MNFSNHQLQKQRDYFDVEFSSYGNYQLENWRISYIKRIFDVLKISRQHEGSKRVTYLDVGVGGSGYTVLEAARLGAMLAVGCDLSFEGAKKALSYAREQKLEHSCFFVVCHAEELPFKNDIFDKISSIAVLEHLPNDVGAITELKRVSTPGGLIYILTPNTYKRIWPFFWIPYWLHDRKVGHLRHYGEEDLIKKFARVGLEHLNVFYNGHLIKVIQFALSKIFTSLNKSDSKLWWTLDNMDFKQYHYGRGLNVSVLFRKNE